MNKAFTPIGLTIVLASVIGGYVLEHGNLHVLWQPVELLIIGGAGLGAFIASCTPHLFKATMKSSFTLWALVPGSPRQVVIESSPAGEKNKNINLVRVFFELCSDCEKC